MVKRKAEVSESIAKAPVPPVLGKKAPPRKSAPAAPAAVSVPKVAGKGKQRNAAEKKKAKRKSRQERSGLHVSPHRCHRILANNWRGGKISKEADVIMAALLQYFALSVVQRAVAMIPEDQTAVGCSELQRAIAAEVWPEKSGLLKVHIMGAALGQGQ